MWATILCVACVENDKDYSDPDSSQENTLDLDIPSDFTWNTSRSVLLFLFIQRQNARIKVWLQNYL